MRSVILACGNPLRGDDGVALRIVCSLQGGYADPNTEIRCAQQWTPELAESISKAELAIFVDASASVPPGEVRLEQVFAGDEHRSVATHSLRPEQLLTLANELYQEAPARAFLLTIGGASFGHGEQLSTVVRRVIPVACDQIKALLSGVTLPVSEILSPATGAKNPRTNESAG
jgi:hydrogenase maturation protease